MTASRVKQIREALGLTQEGFAKYIGVTRSAVAKWELGLSGVHKLRAEKLEALARRRGIAA